MTPILTVVIAAKDPPRNLLIRCLASFATLDCAQKLQVLVVLSGEFPSIDAATAAAFASFDVIETPPRGVYAAYNAGIDSAIGRYLLFFGIDDIALPSVDRVVSRLEEEQFDLFAAPCYIENKGLRQPSADRRSLIRANWCQQGIFYARVGLSTRRFDTRYPIQADHKLNIDIVSNPLSRVGIGVEPVAFFSAGGVSSQQHDLAFIRDFPEIIAAAYGPLFGFLYRCRRRFSVWLRGPIESRYRNPSK